MRKRKIQVVPAPWITIGVGGKVIGIHFGDRAVPDGLIYGMDKNEAIELLKEADWFEIYAVGSLRANHTVYFSDIEPSAVKKTKPLHRSNLA